ncbi:pantothenate synthetase (plasmid) [Escherichia coli]
MTSLKTSIKTITYLSDTGCLEIQGASLFVNSSVLNYGIKASVYGVSASEHSDTVNSEISSRILITLQRYESRLGNPVVEHLFSDDNYSFFSVTALFFMDRVKFCIKWDKHSGEFSLDE